MLDLISRGKHNRKMRLFLVPFLLSVSLPAFAQGKPNTYKEWIKNASDTNSKWIEYKADVNKCRAEFDVAGEY